MINVVVFIPLYLLLLCEFLKIRGNHQANGEKLIPSTRKHVNSTQVEADFVLLIGQRTLSLVPNHDVLYRNVSTSEVTARPTELTTAPTVHERVLKTLRHEPDQATFLNAETFLLRPVRKPLCSSAVKWA